MNIELTPWQEYAKDFLISNRHSCLFAEAGTGKTFPVCFAIEEVCRNKPNMKVAIFSTKTVIESMWKKDIKSMGFDFPPMTIFINMCKAVTETTSKDLLAFKPDIIVFDEVHRIKSPNSQIGKLICKLTKDAEYAWGMTGTPKGNSDLDLYCIYHNLNIAPFDTVSYYNFCSKYAEHKAVYTPYGLKYTPIGILENKQQWFNEQIDKSCIRTKLKIDIDRPIPELIKLPFVKTQEYIEAEKGIITIEDTKDTIARISALTKLRQICNGYMYYTIEDRYTKIYNNNTKLEWVKDFIRNNPDENMIIVYMFAQDLQDLMNTFRNGTDDVDRFKDGKAQLLFLQCSRCEGINLQNCKTMIFYTMDYSYIKYDQMYHRVYRKGQTEEVSIYILMHEGTIEETIWKTVEAKGLSADLFMSAIKQIKGA